MKMTHSKRMEKKKCAQNALKRELNVQERGVLKFIEENGSITCSQLMELYNLKKRRTQVILGQMVKDGLIKKIGASRSTRYVACENR